MGLSIRVFIVEDDDSIKRLPLAHYERLLKRDPNESLPKKSGSGIRYPWLAVVLVNRNQLEVQRNDQAFLDLEEKGQFKESKHGKGES